ncbi:hypothetical protein GCM10020331_033500 [Ectobacillus funiculus]
MRNAPGKRQRISASNPKKLHKELQNQIIEFNEQRDNMLLKAQNEAAEKVEEAKKEAETIIRELRHLRKEQLANVKEHELIEAKKAA